MLPEQIRVAREDASQPSLRPIDPCTARAQTSSPHEAFDAPSTDRPPQDQESPVDSRTAVGASTPLENVPNDVGERPVLFPSCALLAVTPGVVPSARDTEERTKAGYRERAALAFDEREDVGLRSEQNRIAFFRSACSSWSTAWAFSNAWSRLSSRTGTLGAGGRVDDPLRQPSRAS